MTAPATLSAQAQLTQELELHVHSVLDLPSKIAAKRTVAAVIEGLSNILANNVNNPDFAFRLNGIGTFTAAVAKAKTGRNPKTGERVTIPACNRLRLKITKSLQDLGKK